MELRGFEGPLYPWNHWLNEIVMGSDTQTDSSDEQAKRYYAMNRTSQERNYLCLEA